MNLELHTTDRSLYRKCRQQWFFASPLKLNLQPVRSKPALVFGSAWHAGLEALYSNENPQAAFSSYIDNWLNGLGDYLDTEDEEQANEMRDLGYGMLSHYVPWAAKHDKEYFSEVVFVEKSFEVEVPDLTKKLGQRVVIKGKIDGMVKDSHGRYWLIEHKSEAQSDSSEREYLLMDDQAGSYVMCSYLAWGIKVEGVIYNIARKKAPQPLKQLKSGAFSVDKRQDTTYEIVLKALVDANEPLEAYEEFLDYLKAKGHACFYCSEKNAFFERHIVRRNKAEIENLWYAISLEGEEMLTNPGIYRNPSRFNCGNCSFVGPCLAKWENADWQSMLADYIPRET